jgi:hypothetical protein
LILDAYFKERIMDTHQVYAEFSGEPVPLRFQAFHDALATSIKNLPWEFAVYALGNEQRFCDAVCGKLEEMKPIMSAACDGNTEALAKLETLTDGLFDPIRSILVTVASAIRQFDHQNQVMSRVPGVRLRPAESVQDGFLKSVNLMIATVQSTCALAPDAGDVSNFVNYLIAKAARKIDRNFKPVVPSAADMN